MGVIKPRYKPMGHQDFRQWREERLTEISDELDIDFRSRRKPSIQKLTSVFALFLIFILFWVGIIFAIVLLRERDEIGQQPTPKETTVKEAPLKERL